MSTSNLYKFGGNPDNLDYEPHIPSLCQRHQSQRNYPTLPNKVNNTVNYKNVLYYKICLVNRHNIRILQFQLVKLKCECSAIRVVSTAKQKEPKIGRSPCVNTVHLPL